MRYVENEGALFRIKGPSNAFPDEVWSAKEKRFIPYAGEVPKPMGWGDDISAEEAEEMMNDGAPAAAEDEGKP